MLLITPLLLGSLFLAPQASAQLLPPALPSPELKSILFHPPTVGMLRDVNSVLMPGRAWPIFPDIGLPHVVIAPVSPVLLNRVETKIEVKTESEATDIGNSAYAINGSTVARSAGTFGDVPRYLHTLPGVSFVSDLQNSAVVRGGNPFENLNVIDGFEAPNINHLALAGGTGGLVSMLDTALVDGGTFESSGYSAQYSGALSSVLDLRTANPHENAYIVDAGLAGAGVRSQYMFAPDSSLTFAARRSVINYFMDDIGLNGTPEFSNAFGKYLHNPKDADTFTVDVLFGRDVLHMVPTWNDNFETNAYNTDYKGNRSMVGMRWEHLHDLDAKSVVTVSDYEQSQDLSQFDQIHHNDLNFLQKNKEGNTTIAYTYVNKVDETSKFQAGIDIHLHRINFNSDQPLGYLSPYSASQTPVNMFSNTSNYHTKDQGEFIDYVVTHKKYALRMGFRYANWGLPNLDDLQQNQGGAESPNSTVVAHDNATPCQLNAITVGLKRSEFLPQASLSLFLSQRISVSGGYAKYAQAVPYAYTASTPANLTLSPISSQHLNVGASFILSNTRQITAEVYRKTYKDYPVSTDYAQVSLANVIPNLGEAFSYLNLTSSGTGISQGLQLTFTQHPTHHIFFQGNVSFSHATFTGLDNVARPGNMDYPVIANATGGVEVKRYLFTIRNTFTSGKPYTPILAAESLAQNRSIYDLDQINSQRGPFYNRTDVAMNREFKMNKHSLNLHLGMQNIFNRENFYAFFWRPRCPRCGPIAEPAMGIMPDFGITFRY